LLAIKDKMKSNQVSRRNFLKHSSLGLGAGLVTAGVSSFKSPLAEEVKTPRKICVATIDLKGIKPETTRESRIRRILGRMNELTGLKPDLVCLPELFDSIWVDEKKPVKEIAEDETTPGPVTSRIAEFAKANNCYVICPIYTKKKGLYFNSSILLDRKGAIVGSITKSIR
jgi:predicted amidohydrolase